MISSSSITRMNKFPNGPPPTLKHSNFSPEFVNGTMFYNTIDLTCLDWVDEVIIQRLIFELGLHIKQELPELNHVLGIQSGSRMITFNQWQYHHGQMWWVEPSNGNFQVMF